MATPPGKAEPVIAILQMSDDVTRRRFTVSVRNLDAKSPAFSCPPQLVQQLITTAAGRAVCFVHNGKRVSARYDSGGVSYFVAAVVHGEPAGVGPGALDTWVSNIIDSLH